MKSIELEINGRALTAHDDGSISWIHGTSKRLVNSFGYPNDRGYRQVKIGGKMVKVHRITARLLPGYSESLQVDHQNGIKYDNRIKNLRMVTNSENSRASRRKSVGTSSAFRGVCWSNSAGKWVASITVNNKLHTLGCFSDEEEAAMAYNCAAIRFGFFSEALNNFDG